MIRACDEAMLSNQSSRVRADHAIERLEALDHLLLERVKLRPQRRVIVERERVLEALKLHMKLESL